MQKIYSRVLNLLRWAFFGLSGLVGLIAIAGIFIHTYLHRSLPQIDGTMEVSGIDLPLTIIRDDYGIPHIRGENDRDIFFGLGVVHAQDRLWQMEMTRRIAQGRLAEVFGSFAATADIYLRALNLEGAAISALASLPPATVDKLEAYADGVNAILEKKDRPLPPEFFLTRHRPEPWAPKDSVLLVKFLALGLSGNVFSEVIRTRLLDQLSEQQLAEFLPPSPNNWSTLKDLYAQTGIQHLFAQLPPPPLSAASNNWVVSGKHTQSGKPLLANDPHLGLSAPSVWYLAHLGFSDGSVIGGTMPGMPAVLTGRNEHVAWGLTTTGADTQDLYIEQVNSADENEYMAPGGYRPFETREETIKVRFGADRAVTLKESRHGPIVPTEGFLKDLKLANHVLALSWTALRDEDQTVKGGIDVMRARNWKEFRDALKDYHAPMQSIVYGDVDGNIALIAPALVPIRKKGNNALGLVPAPGWDDSHQWIGFIPFDGLPQYLNPSNGMLVTANDKIVDDTYRYSVTREWESDQRARRIRTLLTQTPKHSVNTFREIQMDEISQLALDLLPPLLGQLQTFEASNPLEKEALDTLRGWDGDMASNRAAPLIFRALIRHMSKETYKDELGDQFDLVARTREEFLRRVFGATPTLSHWCANENTEDVKTCKDVVRRSFSDAVQWIEERHGPKLSTWEWGRAHPAIHTHRPFGSFPIIGKAFNIEHASGGGAATINRGDMSGSGDRPFTNVHGSGYRGIYDFSDLNRSIYMQSTGQSGNVLSRHYGDLTKLWARGDYLKMTTDFEEITNAPHSVLRLTPG